MIQWARWMLVGWNSWIRVGGLSSEEVTATDGHVFQEVWLFVAPIADPMKTTSTAAKLVMCQQ